VGGRRLDAADSYYTQKSVGEAMRNSGVNRSDIFVLQKVGPTNPLGYNDSLTQFAGILSDMQITYVDSLLIHWPWQEIPGQHSSDPYCDPYSAKHNFTACRISTWKALIKIYESGQALSIGVANYNITHLQEIIEEGLILPTLNQIPFNPYHSTSQAELIQFCRDHDIVVLGYSPLGIPDWHKFPDPPMPATTPLNDPVVLQIAAAHGRSPAAVILNWEWSLGLPVNPRSMNAAHMLDNLNIYNFTLTTDEIAQLSSRPQDYCKSDNWYECVPNNATLAGWLWSNSNSRQ